MQAHQFCFSLTVFNIQRLQIPELFVSNETQPYWRSGPWNGQIFLGIPDMTSRFLDGTHVQNDGSGNVDGFYSADDLGLVILILNSQGQLQENTWDDVKKEWQVTWISQKSNCDVYGICGAFAICNSQTSPICSCLEGFEPRNKQEWIQQNWTSGCVRSTPLSCETANNQNRSADSNKPDGFLQLQTVKVPDFPEASSITQDQCRSQCLENCFCMAYSYDATIGCMSWNGSLVDIQQFSNAGTDLYIRLANAELGKGKKKTIIIIAMTTIIGVFLVLISAYVIWRRSLHPAMKKNREWFRLKKTVTSEEDTRESIIEELSETELQELLQFKFENLAVATNNFHSSNKLGQGGFGPVYKGKLQNDFGMARIFGGRENEANTQRIVGTYGYMSPEYAMQGVFSEKSDVFSFGVLLLEIISGRRNSSFYDSENSLTLLGFAWIQWCEDNILALIDSEIYDTNLHESIMRCIHIGLLCVQEFAADRPTMATVISMLNSEIVNLFPPREPAFIMRQNMLSAVSSHESLKLYSINTASITEIHGR
ncbi:hypothetical protein RJT34_15963 [Clitoria ternatea]|uniref:Uncharacterized protein n=1 Tax=Clitoria ternatea TaxID=43366 RepID=A0AAN9PD72_CLITE